MHNFLFYCFYSKTLLRFVSVLFNKISIYVKNRKDEVRREAGKGLIEGGRGGGGGGVKKYCMKETCWLKRGWVG